MRRFFRTFFVLAVAIFCAWRALPAGAIGVSPLKHYATVEPGDDTTVMVSVLNTETSTRKFSAAVIGITQNVQGAPSFGAGTDEAEKWTTFEPRSFSLAPGKTQIVRVTVRVPAGTTPGSHLIALAAKEQVGENGQVGVTAQAAVPIWVDVAGEVFERTFIEEWRASKTFIVRPQDVQFHLRFKNVGTVATPVAGTVTMVNPRGETLQDISLTLGSSLFHQSTRELAPVIAVPKSLWGAPGRYGFTIAITYGNSQSVVLEQAALWYVPWPIIVSFVGVIIVFAVLIAFLLRRARRR